MKIRIKSVSDGDNNSGIQKIPEFFFIMKGRCEMSDMKPNRAIQCTVSECANHCESDYCGLNTVKIGTHEKDPTVCQCVDCESFVSCGCK